MTVAKCRFERLQHDAAQLTFAHVYRRHVCPAFRRTVSGEVLGLGDDTLVTRETAALCSTNVSQPQLTGKIWILSEVLLDAAPAGLARQIENWRQDHVDAMGASLRSDAGSGLLGQRDIPRGR